MRSPADSQGLSSEDGIVRFPIFIFKKRGHRTSGSRAWGIIWESLVFAASLAVGGTATVVFVRAWVMPEWRAHQHFKATTAEVLAHDILIRETDQGAQFRPRVRIQYRLPEGWRETWSFDATGLHFSTREECERILARFPVGTSRVCWYDPADVSRVVVVRGAAWRMWTLLLLPIPFLAMGVAGLAYCVANWSTSAERRADITQRMAPQELIEQLRDDGADAFPSVPTDREIRDSPGVRLRYRLPNVANWWRSLAHVAVTTICLATGSSGLIVAWSQQVLGQPDWVVVAFSAALLAAGLVLLWGLGKGVRRACRVGTTRLEIEEHPMVPGHVCEGIVTHTGWAELRNLEVLLVCDEIAIFQQGTDIRTESRRVYEATCLFQSSIHVSPRQPFEQLFSFTVPESGPHSFRSPHNEIRWSLVVRAEAPLLGPYERRYPVIMLPVSAAVPIPGGKRAFVHRAADLDGQQALERGKSP